MTVTTCAGKYDYHSVAVFVFLLNLELFKFIVTHPRTDWPSRKGYLVLQPSTRPSRLDAVRVIPDILWLRYVCFLKKNNIKDSIGID